MQIILVYITFKVFLMISCLNLSQTKGEVMFSESVDGWVESGNYSYYSYNGNYKIKLLLTTHSGDADLYVSQSDASGRTVKPRFDISEHDLQSRTCGQDVVYIDHDFRRPIGIGVYGHPSHESSEFTLDVIGVDYFDDNDRTDGNLYISEDELQFYEEFFGQPYSGLNKVLNQRHKSVNSEDKQNRNGDKSEESHSSETWDFVINLLANILHILLETIL